MLSVIWSTVSWVVGISVGLFISFWLVVFAVAALLAFGSWADKKLTTWHINSSLEKARKKIAENEARENSKWRVEE